MRFSEPNGLGRGMAQLNNPEKALTATIPNCSPRPCAQGAWAAGEEYSPLLFAVGAARAATANS